MCEPVGIVSPVRVARQLERPIRELKPQRLPPFGALAFTDPPALQDDVLAPSLLQDTAHGEPGLAAPDDNDVVLLRHAQPPENW